MINIQVSLMKLELAQFNPIAKAMLFLYVIQVRNPCRTAKSANVHWITCGDHDHMNNIITTRFTRVENYTIDALLLCNQLAVSKRVLRSKEYKARNIVYGLHFNSTKSGR